MWTVDQVLGLAALAGLSVLDILRRRLPAAALAVCGLGAVLCQLCMRRTDSWLILGGILTGLGFLLLSRVTKEGIGYADSLLILILGIYLGLWQLLTVLAGAFFLLLLAAIPLLMIKHMSRKYTLPFLPFLTGGYLAWFLAEGGIL